MGKGSLIWVGAAALVVASCSSGPGSDAPVQTAVASAPASDVLDYAAATQPVGTRMPQMDGDLCRAAELQNIVGQPRTEIPVPVDVINRRVTCTTCPITEDYSPYRLNIFFDQNTGIVEEVRCG
ncbi:hypothetical protein [Brevundimonas sp.]|uniref:hypothetical protein n=1 Tax=Brevundimonas sp. TaxID=1871086 RepID=UPI00391974CD